jgi:hypothetical protein
VDTLISSTTLRARTPENAISGDGWVAQGLLERVDLSNDLSTP